MSLVIQPSQGARGVPGPMLSESVSQLSPFDQLLRRQKEEEEEQKRQAEQEWADILATANDRPLIAQSGGQAASEVGKVAANAVVGAITDYADLVAGVGDIGRAAVGNMPWEDVFNDADNPWVRARRTAFRTETEVGRIVNTFARIGVALASGGVVAKGLGLIGRASKPARVALLGTKAAAKAGKAGRLGRFTSAIAASPEARYFDDFIGAIKKVSQAGIGLTDDAATAARISVSSKAARAANTRLSNVDDILRAPMAERGAQIAQGALDPLADGFFKSWARGIKDSVGVFANPNVSAAVKINQVGKFLAWDAFVDFMVAGEGDPDFEDTVSDVLANYLPPEFRQIASLTLTSPEDTYLTIKLKNMLEGGVIGAALKPLMDGMALARYARAFKRANQAEQLEIIKRINYGNFNDFERWVAAAGQAQADPSRLLPPGTGIARRTGSFRGLAGVSPAEPMDMANNYLGRAATAVEGARRAADLENSMRWQTAQAALPPGPDRPFGAPSAFLPPGPGQPFNATQPPWAVPPQRPQLPGVIPGQPTGTPGLPGAPEPRQLPGVIPGQPTGAPQLPGVQPNLLRAAPGQVGYPGPDRAMLPPAQSFQVPREFPLSLPEPTVTPRTFQEGLEDAFETAFNGQMIEMAPNAAGTYDAIESTMKEMLPRNRADMIQYITDYTPMRNTAGVMPAADAIWWQYTLRTSLQEGWGEIDPNTFGVRFNRALAAALDESDRTDTVSRLTQRARELAEYNPVPVDTEAATRLVQEQTGVPIDTDQAARAAVQEGEAPPFDARDVPPEPAPQADPGPAEAAQEAARAQERAVSDNLAEAEAQAQPQSGWFNIYDLPDVTADMSDQQVVRDLLGVDLDNVPSPYVVKVGRQYQVISEDGTVIASSTTKKGADKIATQEVENAKAALVERARNMANNQQFAEFGLQSPIVPVPSPNVSSLVTMTGPQMRLLAQLPNSRTIQAALGDIQAGLKKSYKVDLSMSDMDQTVRAIDNAIQEGTYSAVDKRTLRTAKDKLMQAISDLGPQARAEKFADDIAEQARRLLDNGEICDWTNF